MKLTSFAVKNYKSVRHQASLDSLQTVNALIGPNNEGKSTVLEALYMARRVHPSRAFPNSENPEEFMLERISDKSIENVFEIQLTIEFNDKELGIL